MKLETPEGFATEVRLLDDLDPNLLPSANWVLIGDRAVQSTWRNAGLPEPPGSEWIETSEHTKRVETLIPWLERWATLPLHRDVTLVAVGGGVLLDMGGLAAGLFLRGVSWQAWPTTLLAQADAGLGGKTGVNLEAGKNLVGLFHPPSRMVVCHRFLDTLPARHVANGRWELVKMALLEGDENWAEELLGRSFPSQEDLHRALSTKARIVHEDLRERGVRRLLNLGHTLGHALESASGYELLHGEAVGLGTLAACFLAEQEGLPAFTPHLLEVMSQALKPLAPVIPCWEACWPWLSRDKKHTGAGGHGSAALHCILPFPGRSAEQRLLPPERWVAAHQRLLSMLH